VRLPCELQVTDITTRQKPSGAPSGVPSRRCKWKSRPELVQLVRTGMAVDAVEGFVEVVGRICGQWRCGLGLDLDGRERRSTRTS